MKNKFEKQKYFVRRYYDGYDSVWGLFLPDGTLVDSYLNEDGAYYFGNLLGKWDLLEVDYRNEWRDYGQEITSLVNEVKHDLKFGGYPVQADHDIHRFLNKTVPQITLQREHLTEDEKTELMALLDLLQMADLKLDVVHKMPNIPEKIRIDLSYLGGEVEMDIEQLQELLFRR